MKSNIITKVIRRSVTFSDFHFKITYHNISNNNNTDENYICNICFIPYNDNLVPYRSCIKCLDNICCHCISKNLNSSDFIIDKDKNIEIETKYYVQFICINCDINEKFLT